MKIKFTHPISSIRFNSIHSSRLLYQKVLQSSAFAFTFLISFWSYSCATSDLSTELMWLSGPSIECSIVGWGSSLSHVTIQYTHSMRHYKVETCHDALVLSLTHVVKSCENLFVKAQNDFYYTYIYTRPRGLFK